jgi:hypothetical protein
MKPQIDLLTDGQSGAGGFIRVFKADGSYVDVNTEKEEEALTELDDMEPFIALVKSTATLYRVSHVRDGAVQEKLFTLAGWEKMVRDNY